ncbi:zinc finger protein [Forsythia ovata]|uniref:Zinc finger protein n=1 Tax=Forsythia ovata TaxID=205694 RepID=A0ABD1PM57_9LAMI
MGITKHRECRVCGSEDPITLHNLWYRGMYGQLCTACVLAHHPASFCPICFDVYDDTKLPPPHLRVMCLRCPSVAHLSCVYSLPSSSSSSSTSYHCPQCSIPNFTFFNLNGGIIQKGNVITKDLAKQLVAAAKIASMSLHKAAAIARENAEKRATEAVMARKRAKEALDKVAFLMLKEAEEDSRSSSNL